VPGLESPQMPNIGAIILAAGSSSRLGRPKQLLKLAGQTLIRRAALAAAGGGCAPVCVVIGANADAVRPELADLSLTIAVNERWQSGIGGSLGVGLATLLQVNVAMDGVAVLIADQPALTADVVQSLLKAWLNSGRPIAASEYAQTLGPPCCFSRAMFPAIAGVADDQGAKHLLVASTGLSVCHVHWPDGAMDVDTETDWRRAVSGDYLAGQ
jgi:molybdenum cofactor cytidylyltransferase